jgi:hypothetical protein
MPAPGTSSPTPPSPRDPAPDGLRLLRRYHEGTLQHQERRAEVCFILEASTGQIVLPTEPGMAGEAGAELVLHLPDEITRDLQLAITPAAITRPEAEEAVDRWQAYHGGSGIRPHARVWLRCAIEGGKRPNSPGDVYGPETLVRPNALRKGEARLVKALNADRDRLARVCKAFARLDVADPLCVGVDPFGFDVRARFGIVRVEFDLEAATAEQAEGLIAALAGRS